MMRIGAVQSRVGTFRPSPCFTVVARVIQLRIKKSRIPLVKCKDSGLQKESLFFTSQRCRHLGHFPIEIQVVEVLQKKKKYLRHFLSNGKNVKTYFFSFFPSR